MTKTVCLRAMVVAIIKQFRNYEAYKLGRCV
jgi:hypothetical protein